MRLRFFLSKGSLKEFSYRTAKLRPFLLTFPLDHFQFADFFFFFLLWVCFWKISVLCYCFREHVELENLKGENARSLEEARKEKVLLSTCFAPYTFISYTQCDHTQCFDFLLCFSFYSQTSLRWRRWRWSKRRRSATLHRRHWRKRLVLSGSFWSLVVFETWLGFSQPHMLCNMYISK